MVDPSEPQAVWAGTITLFGVDISCWVLEDGRRMVDIDAFQQALEHGDPADNEDEDLVAFMRAVNEMGPR